jgi:iron complex outermembrane receptor protein
LGSYELIHTEGVVNVPVRETLGFRAAFSTNKRDGYLSNGGDNEDSKSIRMKGLYQPREDLSFQLTVEHTKDGGSGYSGGVEAFIDESDVSDPWTGIETNSLGYNDQEKWKYTGNIKWDTAYASFNLIPSYTESDGVREMVEASPFGTEEKTYWQDTWEKGAELRIASPEDFMFDWLVGYIYYDSHDGNKDVSLDYQTTGVGTYRLRDIDEKITALFGNITYPVTEEFRLTAGIRKGTDEFVQHGVQNELQTDGSYRERVTDQVMDSPSDPDWKLGFEYDLDQGTMLYGSYSTSYRVQSKYRSLAEPEELKAYQVGSKSRFMSNRLQVNASAYYYEYKNFLARNQDTVWIYTGNGDLIEDMDETVDDSGAAGQGDGRMYGVDVQVSTLITSVDRLDLAVSWEESEWTDLVFDYEHKEELTVIDGKLVWVEIEDIDYTGKSMVFTPPWSITASYSHNFLLPNGGDLKATLDASYKSDYRLTWKEDEYPYNYQESHHLENISLVYSSPGGMWSLTGYVKNLADYAVKTMYRSDRGGFLSIGAPRTYGGVLTVRY